MNMWIKVLLLFGCITSCLAQSFIIPNEARRSFAINRLEESRGEELRDVSFQLLRRLNEPSASPEPGNGTDSNHTKTDPCHTEGSGGHGRRLNEPAAPDCKEEYVPAIPFWQIWLIFIGCGVTVACAVFIVWYYKELAYKPLPSSETKENPSVVAQKRAKELDVARTVAAPIQPQAAAPSTKQGKKNSKNVGEVVDPEKERELASKYTQAAYSLPPPPTSSAASSFVTGSLDSTNNNEYLGGADPTQVDIAIREAAASAANTSHQRRLDRIAAASGIASASKKREFLPQPGSLDTSALVVDESAPGSMESTNLSSRRIEESTAPSNDMYFTGEVSRRESADEDVSVASTYNSREIEASMEFSTPAIEPILPSATLPRSNVPIDLPKIPTKPKIISIPKPVVKASSSSMSSLPSTSTE